MTVHIGVNADTLWQKVKRCLSENDYDIINGIEHAVILMLLLVS